ncbi:TraB/GumN family protein [Erythrobacter alti]|uniref:TraB/GumN family protein n=1 Tax=Erythrobacter alti TaxID=1896145 RepID=UPI0030F4AEB7
MQRRFLHRILAAFACTLLAVPASGSAQSQPAEPNRFAFTQDYEPSPAIWILSDEDTTIYMLGTIHSLPRGFEWRNERIDAIIEEAEELVVESSAYANVPDPVDVDTKLAARIASRLPTSSRLSEAGSVRWRQLIRSTGLDFDTVDTMPVLVALMTLGMSGGEYDTSSPVYGVESVLEQEFLERERPIVSIEDWGEVMYSLLRLDGSEILGELDSSLVAWDGKTASAFFDPEHVARSGNAYWEAEHNWARGIVADNFDIGLGSGAIGRAFNFNLLDRRNAAWAIWLEERLEQPGTVLLAVGAGHFEGDNTVLDMLEARGLVAQRLN